MSTRLRHLLRASALVLVLCWTASGSAAAQGWSPSRLPDGQPDIDYEATIEDPKVFTQPWKIAYTIVRLRDKNFELIEEACWEGVSISNRLDAGRIAAKSGIQKVHSHSER